MEEILKEGIKQVPSLAIFALVAIMSLRALLKFIESRDVLMKLMHDEHLQAREQSRDAINQNAEAIRSNAVATNQNTLALQELRNTIQERIHST